MSTVKWVCGFVFLYLIVLIGSAFASTELLYVQEGSNVVTYSVNSGTAATKKLGTLATNFEYVLSVNRSGSFLYILGFTSDTAESFSVYALTSAGVPVAKPVQTLVVKPALTQFVIHPNGKFAYAEYSWTDNGGGPCQGTYYADIVLYTINPKTGKLTNTTKPVANFPCNSYAVTYIFGLNSTGTKLYIDNYPADAQYDDANFIYYYSTINTATGALGPQVQFWSDIVSPNGERSAFTNSLIAQSAQQNNESEPAPQINIYPNALDPTTPTINCTSSMLSICGDMIAAGDTATGLYFHPSGKYLFAIDISTNEVPIIYISLALKKLEASSSSIPGNPSTVAFSPDGLLVYAIEGSEILVYVFNPHTGLLTARTSVAAPDVGLILPAK
jgi:hypothetical protein